MYALPVDSTLAARLAANIAQALAERGISLRDVMNATGIPTTTLHRRLSGHVPFTFTELELIAPLIGATVGVLVAQAEASAA